MPEPISLSDYERAERSIAMKEARRGLMIHAIVAIVSLVFHSLGVLRWGQKSLDRKQARVERTAMNLKVA
jgi:hypothetical protein